jgi:hypothetical protein
MQILEPCPQKNVSNLPYLRGTTNILNANGDALLALSPHVAAHLLLVSYVRIQYPMDSVVTTLIFTS